MGYVFSIKGSGVVGVSVGSGGGSGLNLLLHFKNFLHYFCMLDFSDDQMFPCVLLFGSVCFKVSY